VFGTVALWGLVVEHDLGYRARWAYPQRLRLICPHCFFERSTGGAVPDLVVARGDGGVVPLCDRHVRLSLACGIGADVLTDVSALEQELLGAYAVDLLPLRTGAPSPSIA
jgi:hypothetical protein